MSSSTLTKKSAGKKTPDEKLTDAVKSFEDTAKAFLQSGVAASVRLDVSMNSGGITRCKLGFERAL